MQYRTGAAWLLILSYLPVLAGFFYKLNRSNIILMRRDGDLKSLWQNDIGDYQPVNNWNKNDIYDVLIVGGGITGLTAALLLQSEGKKCILAEAANIGFGTTGGTTAHLNTVLDTSYADIEKKFSKDDAKLVSGGTREAIDLVEGLINKYHIDCEFSYQPAYIFSENEKESEALKEIKDATKRAGVMTTGTDSIPVPMPFHKAIRVEIQAQFHPLQYLQGLARAYEQEGGILLQQCTVHQAEEGTVVTADTTLGEIRAMKVIYATHIPPGINLLHFRCPPYRSYAMAVTLADENYPAGLVYDMKDPYHYLRTQEINGKKYLVAGGFDHPTGDGTNTEHQFRELEAYIRKYYQVDIITNRWSSQYFNSTDGLPYIGLLPGADNIYTGTGYSGNGMVLGSLAAKIMCELITKGESKYQRLFDPSRIKPIAGFKEFVKANANVISKFIGMRFSYEHIETLAALAPGEGVLADWENKKVALYKNENGKVYAVDPVCPHAGCLVAWNGAEKSWDCPCHGSRFSCNGALLTGPATKGLAPIINEDHEGD